MRARAYYAAVVAVVALNLVVAAQHVSHAPLVDGWVVWHRVMQLDRGQLSLADYLLGFFGAHPHSVVLLLSLLDHRLVDADQRLLAVASHAAVAAFALFCAHRFLAWARLGGASGGTMLLGGVAVAALATTLADWEVMTLPFQGVLPVSRLAYVLLLWWLIRALRPGSASRPWLVTALSCLAVTFHGTGPLFALVFLLVHLLRYAGPGRLLGGAAPLAVALLHARFFKDGGELDNLGSIVSASGLANVSKALLAYFATPLAPLRAVLRDAALLPFGLAVLGFTAWLTSRCLLGEASKRLGRAPARPADDERLFAGALGLLVLLSGAAAAALMTIRMGAGSYHPMLTSSRYIAYALIPYVLILCALVRPAGGPPRRKGPALGLAALLAAAGLYPALVFSASYQMDVRLARAVAALSVGMSPIEPPAKDIWPTARDDWYWVEALGVTVEHLVQERAGPWSQLPALGQTYVGRRRPPEIGLLGTADCAPACPAGVVQFSGAVSARTDGAFRRSRTIAVLDAAGRVVGFAAQVRPQVVSRRREYHGYLAADASTPSGRLFVGPSDGAYVDAAAGHPARSEPHGPLAGAVPPARRPAPAGR